MRSQKRQIIFAGGIFLFFLQSGLARGEAGGSASQNPSNAKHSELVMPSPGSDWIDVAPLGFPNIWVEKSPWWRVKPKAVDRLNQGRAVLVSVVVEEKSSTQPLNRLRMSGAGNLKASSRFAFDRVREFQRLKDLSEYVKEASFNESKSQLFLHVAAFKYHARMLMQMAFTHSETQHQILFHVIGGTMKGMRGVVKLEDIERRGTEMSMTAFYDYEKLPIPQFFVEFGLEIVLQKIAEALRDNIETLWEKNQNPPRLLPGTGTPGGQKGGAWLRPRPILMTVSSRPARGGSASAYILTSNRGPCASS